MFYSIEELVTQSKNYSSVAELMIATEIDLFEELKTKALKDTASRAAKVMDFFIITPFVRVCKVILL